MIRINLISEGRTVSTVRSSRLRALNINAENVAVWALLTLFVVGLLGYGGWWLTVSRQLESRREQIADLQETVAELEEIIREVERFEARKVELEHKINVISNLRSNQRGPVYVMDRVSRALPDFLWLERLHMTASSVTIRGKAFTTTSVANFIESLDLVEEFREPVLRNATWQRNVYDFQLVFSYVPVPVNPQVEGAAAGPDAQQAAR
jgi:type IV pilus assembly protein PilN